ncbi:hypothetical protein IDJ81_14325 [Tsuneonella flava]|uniref:Uncharacterized protein n=1 Tax=Tsuneonella flava TaxID=2055955 RepID=A0ABX7KD77_9SPHN|nr:hypothetical protein [Tsuneonella flava]QSB44455.1 hypothetical protein IDJ81_14325 [Tsuneonella flava]
MRQLPWVIGAIAATVAGVVCGITINTSPLSRWDGQTLGEFASHQPPAISPDRYREMQGPQDRYAMTTPDGVVPVEQLSDRGLYANDRFARTWYANEPEFADSNTQRPQDRAASASVSDSSTASKLTNKVHAMASGTKPLKLAHPIQIANARPIPTSDGNSADGPKVVDMNVNLASQPAARTIQ